MLGRPDPLRGIPKLRVRHAIPYEAYEPRIPMRYVEDSLKRQLGAAITQDLRMTYVGRDIGPRDESVFEMEVYAFTEAEMASLVERIRTGRI